MGEPPSAAFGLKGKKSEGGYTIRGEEGLSVTGIRREQRKTLGVGLYHATLATS